MKGYRQKFVVIGFCSLFAMIVSFGCQPKVREDHANVEKALEDKVGDSHEENGQEGDCHLFVNLQHFVEEDGLPEFVNEGKTRIYNDLNPSASRMLYLQYDSQREVVHKEERKAVVLRSGKGKFYQLIGRTVSKNDFILLRDIVMWPLHNDEKEIVVFSRQGQIKDDKYSLENRSFLRSEYEEIGSDTLPLPGEELYDEKPNERSLYFFDNSYYIGSYNNVVYFYEGFKYADYWLTCYGEEDCCEEDGCGCSPRKHIDNSCISHAVGVVLHEGEGGVKIEKHRSMVPEYYDGKGFKALYKVFNPSQDWHQSQFLRESYYPSDEKRSFALLPYALYQYELPEDMPWKLGMVSIIGPRSVTTGNQGILCNRPYYDNTWMPAVSLDFGEQSLIYGIPYDEAPEGLKGIIEGVSQAPNRCGYIDWKNLEVVFGKTRYPAKWLSYVNSVHWLEADEEFPLDKVVNEEKDFPLNTVRMW